MLLCSIHIDVRQLISRIKKDIKQYLFVTPIYLDSCHFHQTKSGIIVPICVLFSIKMSAIAYKVSLLRQARLPASYT